MVSGFFKRNWEKILGPISMILGLFSTEPKAIASNAQSWANTVIATALTADWETDRVSLLLFGIGLSGHAAYAEVQRWRRRSFEVVSDSVAVPIPSTINSSGPAPLQVGGMPTARIRPASAVKVRREALAKLLGGLRDQGYAIASRPRTTLALLDNNPSTRDTQAKTWVASVRLILESQDLLDEALLFAAAGTVDYDPTVIVVGGRDSIDLNASNKRLDLIIAKLKD